jgi:hypothetical protein
MPEPEEKTGEDQERIAVLAVVLAGALAVAMAEGDHTFLDSVIGAVLLIVLCAYKTEANSEKFWWLAAFAATFAFCCVLIIAAPLNYALEWAWFQCRLGDRKCDLDERLMDGILAGVFLVVVFGYFIPWSRGLRWLKFTRQ